MNDYRDVSKLQLNGEIFNIKDSSARNSTKTLFDILGNEFNESLTYEVGDYVLKDNILYKFLEQKSRGKWNPNIVEACVVLNELGKGSTSINNHVVYLEDTEGIMFYTKGMNIMYSEDSEGIIFGSGTHNSSGSSSNTQYITDEDIKFISEKVAAIISNNMSEITREEVLDMLNNK